MTDNQKKIINYLLKRLELNLYRKKEVVIDLNNLVKYLIENIKNLSIVTPQGYIFTTNIKNKDILKERFKILGITLTKFNLIIKLFQDKIF